MDTADFNFELPQKLIAQNPVVPRDHSRLLVLNRSDGRMEHKHFYDLPDLLEPGDVLVVNDTKVVPARIFGTIPEVGSGRVEVLLLNERVEETQRAMVKPGKKFQPGRVIVFDDQLQAEVVAVEDDGCRLLRFNCTSSELTLQLDRIGHPPIPPYIKQSTASREQYQTIYANDPGSSAAPTAGLHFTADVFDRLESKGITVEKVTLHVGRGTFQEVKAEQLENHVMHSETYELRGEVAVRLNRAKQEGRRIIAVGTTSVRVLESSTNSFGNLIAGASEANLFVYPGYRWKIVDAMITNFHLPKSTLLMLVSSFAGQGTVQEAYREAIRKEYRFFSFGDAMFIF